MSLQSLWLINNSGKHLGSQLGTLALLLCLLATVCHVQEVSEWVFMRAEISNSRVKSRFHICSFVALNSSSSDSLTFTLKMLLMTPPPSFYTEMCVCNCSGLCGNLCQHKHPTLELRLSQQSLWHMRASSISGLSHLKVHSCEWCWSAISSETEESSYLCLCWPSLIHKHTCEA